MNTSRRGFLKLFGSLVATTAADSVFGKNTLSIPQKLHPESHPNKDTSDINILWNAYFPLLKENEGESLCFYRCFSSKNILVGYGCNVEANPHLLKDIQVYKDNKPISIQDHKKLLSTLKTKDAKELKHYSISQTDAQKMAKAYVKNATEDLDRFLSNTKTHGTFFQLPVPMQLLALDIFYNVGINRFKKYKKFKAALLNGDYEKATKESVVYLGKNITNPQREQRKKRLGRITKIIHDNAGYTLSKIQELVHDDYKRTTPKLTKILSGNTDKTIEDAVVCGEFNHRALRHALAQNKNKPAKSSV